MHQASGYGTYMYHACCFPFRFHASYLNKAARKTRTSPSITRQKNSTSRGFSAIMAGTPVSSTFPQYVEDRNSPHTRAGTTLLKFHIMWNRGRESPLTLSELILTKMANIHIMPDVANLFSLESYSHVPAKTISRCRFFLREFQFEPVLVFLVEINC